ncbi:MAG: O-antigen ligase family protein [Planctomycetota bacterium]
MRRQDAPALLLSLLALVPLLNGGFLEGTWTGLAFVVGVAALLALRMPVSDSSPGSPALRSLALLLLLGVGWGLIQVVPLPDEWRSVAAPGAMALDRSLGRDAGFFPLSQDPAATRTVMVALLTGSVLLLVSSRVQHDLRGRRIVASAIVASAVVVAGMHLLDLCLGSEHLWHSSLPEHARPFGPFVNRNHGATLLLLALPLAVALGRDWLQAGAVRRGNAALLGAVAIFVGLLFNGSRGGAIAFVLTLTGASLLVRLPLRWKLLALGAAVLLVVLPGVASTRAGETTTLGQRALLARDALTMAKDAPITGVGLGSFGVAYRPYHSVPRFLRFEHVESEPLEILVEGGVPLLLLAMAAATILMRVAARALRMQHSLWLGKGAAVGVMAVFLHACFDFPLRTPGVTVPALLVTAILCQQALEEEAR